MEDGCIGLKDSEKNQLDLGEILEFMIMAAKNIMSRLAVKYVEVLGNHVTQEGIITFDGHVE